MFELIVLFTCAGLVVAACFALVGQAERRMLAEMSDAAVAVYGIWDDDGIPLNKYAEEHDRRLLRKGDNA